MTSKQEEELSYRKGRAACEDYVPSVHFNQSQYQSKYSVKYPRKIVMQHAPKLSLGDQILIAAGYQQAIVKVTNYGKGKTNILAHLKYISRHEKLHLEDQDGNHLKSVQDFKEQLDTWAALYFDGRKNARDTVHITFSTPQGSDRSAVLKATKKLLEEEFKGQHDYVFVAHNDTKHPHIHVVVVMQSYEGKKMDPRKPYILLLRKKFAEKCREEGINVEASRRYERGLPGKSTPSAVAHLVAKRKIQPDIDRRLVERVKQDSKLGVAPGLNGQLQMRMRNQSIRKLFADTAKMLRVEKNSNEILQVARSLDDYAKTMPREETRSEYFLRHVQSAFFPEESQVRYEQYLAVTQGYPNQNGIYEYVKQDSILHTKESVQKTNVNGRNNKGNELASEEEREWD